MFYYKNWLGSTEVGLITYDFMEVHDRFVISWERPHIWNCKINDIKKTSYC